MCDPSAFQRSSASGGPSARRGETPGTGGSGGVSAALLPGVLPSGRGCRYVRPAAGQGGCKRRRPPSGFQAKFEPPFLFSYVTFANYSKFYSAF